MQEQPALQTRQETVTVVTTREVETTDDDSINSDGNIYNYLLMATSAYGIVLLLIGAIMTSYDVITQEWVLGFWTTDIIFLLFLAMFSINIVPRSFDSYTKGVILVDWSLLLVIFTSWVVVLAVWCSQIAVFVDTTQYLSGWTPGNVPEPPISSGYSSSRRVTFGFVFALETVNLVIGLFCVGLSLSAATSPAHRAAKLASVERLKHRMFYDPVVFSEQVWAEKARDGVYGEKIQSFVVQNDRLKASQGMINVNSANEFTSSSAGHLLQVPTTHTVPIHSALIEAQRQNELLQLQIQQQQQQKKGQDQQKQKQEQSVANAKTTTDTNTQPIDNAAATLDNFFES